MQTGPNELNQLLESPISTLANELIVKIGSYVPAYQFYGSNSVLRVCKQWEAIFSSDLFNHKRNRSQLINACQTEEDALRLLSNPTACKQLSFCEILEIAGKSPSLTQFILDNHTHLMHGKYEYEYLRRLGMHSLESAMLILNLPTRAASPYVDPHLERLVSLSPYHPSIAWILLRSQKNVLLNRHVGNIASASFEIALFIISKEELCKKLSPNDFASLTGKYPQLIDLFFDHKKLLKEDLTLNEEKEFLSSELKLNSKFRLFDLANLEKNHLETARMLFKMPKEIDFYFPFINHTGIARDVFNHYDSSLNESQLLQLGITHADIAWDILEKPTLACKLTAHSLSILASYYHDIAWHILNTAHLKSILLAGEKPYLHFANLAANHLDIIRHILKPTDLYKIVSSHNEGLEQLTHFHLESAERLKVRKEETDTCNQIINKAKSLLEGKPEGKKERKYCFFL